MDLAVLRKKYEEMSIEELGLFLESYNEDDFITEAQGVINEVVVARRKELDEYRQQKAEDYLVEEVESRVNDKLISRKVTCKSCNYKGLIEAHDTQNYPKDKIFKLLGKDYEGYIHLTPIFALVLTVITI